MGEFIKSYGAFILAFISFAQFWVKILWEKYLRKGEIEYYETGAIEIGYSGIGPTISLNGTLRALNKDVFIRSIDLLVVRGKDKAQHDFRWIAFRSPKTDIAGSQPVSMEIPSGFLISPNSPHRFNIVFNDNALYQDIRPLFHEYILEWYKVVQQLTKIWSPSLGVAPPNEIVARQLELIENFRKSQIHVDTYTAFDRKCYWESDDYKLTINVIASKPDRVFSKTYRFSIHEADSNNLKLNVITILEEPVSNYLRVQNYPYNFAYSAYS